MAEYPLRQAYNELKEQCDAHDIKIGGNHLIIHARQAIQVDIMTGKKDCLKLLRSMIKKAKKDEFERTQGSLL